MYTYLLHFHSWQDLKNKMNNPSSSLYRFKSLLTQNKCSERAKWFQKLKTHWLMFWVHILKVTLQSNLKREACQNCIQRVARLVLSTLKSPFHIYRVFLVLRNADCLSKLQRQTWVNCNLQLHHQYANRQEILYLLSKVTTLNTFLNLSDTSRVVSLIHTAAYGL